MDRLRYSGFWTFRFLVSPEEFAAWREHLARMGMRPIATSAEAWENADAAYRVFYEGLVSPVAETRHTPSLQTWLECDRVETLVSLQKEEWWFDVLGEGRKQRDFYVELCCPKGVHVSDPDGVHYSYVDILSRDPDLKRVFDELAAPIKACTRPLYEDINGTLRAVYSFRISDQAWADLADSAFREWSGRNLVVKASKR